MNTIILQFDRMSIIAMKDPVWFQDISRFLEENTEFQQLLPYVALTRFPIGYNKNPGETYRPDAPSNLFEAVLFGIAESGVRATYGQNQYNQIMTYIRNMPLCDIYFQEFPFRVQPKKQPIYHNFIQVLIKHGFKNQTDLNTISQLHNIADELKGVGPTTIHLCEMLFGSSNEVTIPYTDRGFRSGYSKFYKIPKPTKRQMLDTAQKWTNKTVGIMFVMQCFYYYNL